MIDYIRRLTSGYPKAYGIAAKIYHEVQFFHQYIYYVFIKKVYVYRVRSRKKGKYFSQFGQDYVIEKYFEPKKNGFFIDVGSNHPTYNSNSYFFEKNFNYRGISVDAIDYSKLYEELRPSTRFVNAILSDAEKLVKFDYVESQNGWEDQLSGIASNKLGGKRLKSKVVEKNAIKLSSILTDEVEIDILFVDVEGHEIEVLAGLNLEKFRPQIIMCENSGPIRTHSKLRRYLTAHGYKFVARVWTSDDIYINKK